MHDGRAAGRAAPLPTTAWALVPWKANELTPQLPGPCALEYPRPAALRGSRKGMPAATAPCRLPSR